MQVEDPAVKHCSKEGPHYCLGAKREQESCHLTSDNQLLFTSWISYVIPTWAVLRRLANVRKCQLEDYCEKGMSHVQSNGRSQQTLSAEAEKRKFNGSDATTRSPRASCF